MLKTLLKSQHHILLYTYVNILEHCYMFFVKIKSLNNKWYYNSDYVQYCADN